LHNNRTNAKKKCSVVLIFQMTAVDFLCHVITITSIPPNRQNKTLYTFIFIIYIINWGYYVWACVCRPTVLLSFRMATLPYSNSPYGNSPYGNSPYGNWLVWELAVWELAVWELAVWELTVWELTVWQLARMATNPYGNSPYGNSPVWQLARMATHLYGLLPYGSAPYSHPPV